MFSDSFYQRSLPEKFIEGLTSASFDGRAQIVADRYIGIESPEGLVFYLDGAHSPESMEVCARWFSAAIRHNQRGMLNRQSEDKSTSDKDEARKTSVQVDFNFCSTSLTASFSTPF